MNTKHTGVERLKILMAAQEEILSLKKERDELLAALREIRRIYTPNGNLARDIDKAIAKAGGRP